MYDNIVSWDTTPRAALERGENQMQRLLGTSPYSAPLARLAMVRSAGVTDLRFGSLLDEDWACRNRFESDNGRIDVPLPQHVECYAVAATLGRWVHDLTDRLLGATGTYSVVAMSTIACTAG